MFTVEDPCGAPVGGTRRRSAATAAIDNGDDFGVSMQYVVEDTPLGTAGAVKMADKLLAGETFLVISGDALTDIDLTALVEHHRREGNDVTIALQRVTNPRGLLEWRAIG